MVFTYTNTINKFHKPHNSKGTVCVSESHHPPVRTTNLDMLAAQWLSTSSKFPASSHTPMYTGYLLREGLGQKPGLRLCLLELLKRNCRKGHHDLQICDCVATRLV